MWIVQPLFPKTTKRNISFDKFCKEVQRFANMISRLSGGYCSIESDSGKYNAIEIGNELFVVVINEAISSKEMKEKAYCITKAKNWREAIENIRK